MFQVVERSIGSLVNDIVGNVQEIIRSEVRLAKAEVTEELTKARRAMAGQENDIPVRLTCRQKRIPIRTSLPFENRIVCRGMAISTT